MSSIHYPAGGLSPEQFHTEVNGQKPVLVDFYATWCEPCRYLDAILEELVAACGESVRIIKLDVDEQPALRTQYSLMSVPTLMIFKNGVLQWRMAGFMLSAELQRKLEEYY